MKLLIRKSNNAAPRLIPNDLHVLQRYGTSELPLFPANYDWRDQEDVYGGVIHVAALSKIEDWDRLFTLFDSEDYCVTIRDESVNVNPRNMSVGFIARKIAFQRLSGVYKPSVGLDSLGRSVPLSYGIDTVNDLVEWRGNRRDKKFYELQMEVGERLLNSLENNAKISNEQKVKMSNYIAGKLEEIKHTKSPQFVNFPGEAWSLYNKAAADEIRQRIGEK